MLKKKTFDWITFGFNLSSSMFYLINGIVFIGSLSLYTSLIAETGMLKFNGDSNVKMEQKMSKPVYAHDTKIYSGFPPQLDKEIRTPLVFESQSNDNISNNIFINSLKKTDITVLHYIKKILFSMIDNNYTVINTVYSLLYKLPESLLLCLSLYGTPLLWFVMFFVNMGLAGFYHIYHFKEIFVSCGSDGQCSSGMVFGPTKFVVAFIYWFFFAFPMTMFVYPSIAMAYSYLSPLIAPFINSKTGKKYNFIEYVIDMLSYKRQLIMWLISLTLVRVVYMSLGATDAFSCLASIMVLAAFTRIYSQYLPPELVQKK